ncbi:hypothetical protein [Brachybacterium sp. GPGPB12]|uniref:hypothetical protein n=1 Tax=Brachybacterium sp. GPGPB12 TaxID=3023517 RepID=UPI0031345877
MRPTPPELDVHRHREDWRAIAERWPEQAWSSEAVLALLDQLDAAERRIRDLTQEVRDERGAARDQMEQVRIRDARIKAVEDVLERPIRHVGWDDPLVPTTHVRRALESVPPPGQ